MNTWGMAIGPTRGAMIRAIERRLVELPKAEQFQYLEYGIAEGGTIAGVARELDERMPDGRWRVCGVDIMDGWGLNVKTIHDNLRPWMAHFSYSLEGSQAFLAKPGPQFDLILIDGCHGENCCALDYEASEKRLKPGGLIVLHDADEACQGMDLQPHCQQTIGVRAAAKKLGLLNGGRPGVRLIEDVAGDAAGRGCIVIHKY